MSRLRSALLGLLLLGAVAVLALPGESAAKKVTSGGCTKGQSGAGKGKLVIYGNPPPAQFQPVLQAFAKSYPKIKVSYSDVDDNVAFAKYRAEHAEGARTADIIIASSPAQWVANRKIALCWTPAGAANYPGYLKQFPGVLVLSPDPAVSIYSKAQLPASDVPDTFAQLETDLKQNPTLFQGKIVTYSVQDQFGYSAFWGFEHEFGWSPLRLLGPATKPQSDGTAMAEQLATGAANYGFFESGLIRSALTGPTGQVIGWTYMHDFTPLIPRGVAITQGARNSAAAKTFLDWAYSAAGQQVLCAAGFTAFRHGVSCANSLLSVDQAVGAKHVFFVPFNGTIGSDESAFDARWRNLFK